MKFGHIVGILGLALIAGCQDRTYPAPTDEFSLTEGPPLDAIPVASFAGVQTLGDRLLEGDHPGTHLISPVGAYQTLAILFNGAEGKTYDVLAKLLSAEKAERFDINDAQRAWRETYAATADNPVMLETGIWMVWPVLVTKTFQKEMASTYQADIVKLGSAGLGATKAVNAWAAKRSHGQISEVIETLKIEDQIITTSMISAKVKWKQAFRSEANGNCIEDGDFLVARATNIVAVSIPTEGDAFDVILALPSEGSLAWQPTAKLSPKLEKVRVIFPTVKLRYRTNLRGALMRIGAESLFRGPNDLRNLSIEFDRHGRLDSMWQEILLDLGPVGIGNSEKGEPTETSQAAANEIRFDQRFQILIRDRKTGSPIIQGWIDPATIKR